MQDIREVLAHIEHMNINRCAITTYDLGVQECVREEIIQALARHYGCVYHQTVDRNRLFPVKGSNA